MQTSHQFTSVTLKEARSCCRVRNKGTTERSKPWKAGLLFSSKWWPGHLFVKGHSYRRVGQWRCRWVQLYVSVSEARFLSEGSPGTFNPLLAHPSHIIGDSFAFLLATPFPSKGQFRTTQEVGPSSGVVARRDSGHNSQEATGPGFLGGFGVVRPE